MNNFFEYLLNNYPNSLSIRHRKDIYNIDWYPFCSRKFGYTLTPCCQQYKGYKLNDNNLYQCYTCFEIFLVCDKCYSYCINNKRNIYNNRIYTILYNSIPKLSNALIKIIYKYTLFHSLYGNGMLNDYYCPRCSLVKN